MVGAMGTTMNVVSPVLKEPPFLSRYQRNEEWRVISAKIEVCMGHKNAGVH